MWFLANYGSSQGSFVKLWIDDHFIIHSHASSLNATAVSLYPLRLNPSGSLLRIEYGVIGINASMRLFYGFSQKGPWLIIPPQSLSSRIPAPEANYQSMRSQEESGWNTWDQHDMLASVLLPSGISFSLSFFDSHTNFSTSKVRMLCGNDLRTGLHSARGNYTEIEHLDLHGGAASVKIETATTAIGDLIILVTTVNASRLSDVILTLSVTNILPFSACYSNVSISNLSMVCAGTKIQTIRPLNNESSFKFVEFSASSFSFNLAPLGYSIAMTTSSNSSLSIQDAVQIVSERRAQLLSLFSSFEKDNETFAGLYTAISWTAIYSYTQGIVNGEFGRNDVIFEWDTFLASALALHVDKWMCYNNIVRQVKGAIPNGMVPGFIQDQFGEVDNSKPPVGALVLQSVYNKFRELWLIELVIDGLVAWNLWWSQSRMVRGFTTFLVCKYVHFIVFILIYSSLIFFLDGLLNYFVVYRNCCSWYPFRSFTRTNFSSTTRQPPSSQMGNWS